MYTLSVIDNIVSALSNVTVEVAKIATPLAVLVLAICGVTMMLGKKMSEEAKDRIMKVITGFVIVLCASSMITWINSIFNFSV